MGTNWLGKKKIALVTGASRGTGGRANRHCDRKKEGAAGRPSNSIYRGKRRGGWKAAGVVVGWKKRIREDEEDKGALGVQGTMLGPSEREPRCKRNTRQWFGGRWSRLGANDVMV